MRRTPVAVLVSVSALLAGTLGAVPTAAGAPPGQRAARGAGLEVYTGVVDAAGMERLGEAGVDRGHAVRRPAGRGKAAVEVVLNRKQAAALAADGVDLTVRQVDGVSASTALRRTAADGYTVFRPYSGPDGLAAELRRTARAHPRLTKLERIGTSGQGQPILAVKVTTGARYHRDGAKPAVLYGAAQHAREWITPEMVRRLMHAMIDGYGADPEITRLLRTRELWFLPVQNPDGYDFTFTEGHRLWRKTMRDNDGDGVITTGDGVDMNRNFAYKWGYDNEGSFPVPASETYRGPRAASEPETRATTGLVDRVGFSFFVNYHSAAQLLLYGVGWQVETPTPDDVVYRALAGDDADPGVPGYDPDLSAELYTTNGDTDGEAHEGLGTLAFTPEMSTCATASNLDPSDDWDAADCASGFSFPDDETLVEGEFEKNIPFALSVADSAADPADPSSSLDRTAPDLVDHPFPLSYGTRQQVAVTADRQLRALRMRYSIDGGPERSVRVREYRGGQRYGGENDVYYADYRAVVPRQSAGDRVSVRFTASKPGRGRVSTEPFRYRVDRGIGGDVLVLAAEDYTGASPVQEGGPAAAAAYASQLRRAGYRVDRYDVDARGRRAPDPLGVLSPYDLVVWETGEDIIPRNADQPGGTAAKWGYDTELAVRDYVNDGGKLVVAGKFALYAQGADGAYYYQPDERTAGSCTTPGAYPCLPLGNDFSQYWLGAYGYLDDAGTGPDGPRPLVGKADSPFAGFAAPVSAGQDHTAGFVTTSSVLPADEFPQFSSTAPLAWSSGGPDPYSPYTGDWFVAAQHADAAYKRLSRTVDLTDAGSGTLDFQLSADLETDYDYAFVEARPVATEDWTTLPDANGHTSSDVGDSCAIDWSSLHPQLLHYQGADCSPAGTTGEWNATTGNTGGWQDWSVDLSAYAGQQVEVSITVATDFSAGGLGVWVDDAAVSLDGAPAATTSFEDGLDGWTVPGPPAGTAGNANDWVRSQDGVDVGAATLTEDTAYFGLGLEGLSRSDRAEVLERTLRAIHAD